MSLLSSRLSNTTTNVGLLSGGVAINVVPDTATAGIVVRERSLIRLLITSGVNRLSCLALSYRCAT